MATAIHIAARSDAHSPMLRVARSPATRFRPRMRFLILISVAASLVMLAFVSSSSATPASRASREVPLRTNPNSDTLARNDRLFREPSVANSPSRNASTQPDPAQIRPSPLPAATKHRPMDAARDDHRKEQRPASIAAKVSSGNMSAVSASPLSASSASRPKSLVAGTPATARVETIGLARIGSAFPLADMRPLYLTLASGISIDSKSDFETYDPSHKTYPSVRRLARHDQKRILVTGGAGFVGSHLVDRLMKMGHLVTVVDNFFTGSKRNIEHWLGHPNFELIRHDVVDPFMMEADQIYHLACPASPPHYQYNPIKTVKTSVMGTINMLGLSKRVRARFLLASTSEIYGDPEIHPQHEDYWGHVNPIGPRACYDEGKRVAETLTYSYAQQDHVDVRVVRIFNTFGPRMNPDDGRVVSNFIMQALRGENLTVYGDGSQTRSFQYVHDLVDGLIQTMNSNYTQPINLGNPEEYTIKEFAEIIRDRVNPNAKIIYTPGTKDDPQRRRPDITRARDHIEWDPKFTVEQGIDETIEYFRAVLKMKQL